MQKASMAEGFQDILEIPQLAWRNQPRQGQPSLATTDGDLDGLKSLAGADARTPIQPGGAFDRQGIGQAGIPQVKMPAGNLNVEPIGEGLGQLLELFRLQTQDPGSDPAITMTHRPKVVRAGAAR